MIVKKLNCHENYRIYSIYLTLFVSLGRDQGLERTAEHVWGGVVSGRAQSGDDARHDPRRLHDGPRHQETPRLWRYAGTRQVRNQYYCVFFIILISQCNSNSISLFFSMLIFFSALGKFFLVIYQFFFSERIFWMVEILK